VREASAAAHILSSEGKSASVGPSCVQGSQSNSAYARNFAQWPLVVGRAKSALRLLISHVGIQSPLVVDNGPRRGMPLNLFVLWITSVIALRRKKRGGKSRRAGPTARRGAVKIDRFKRSCPEGQNSGVAFLFVVDPTFGAGRLPAPIVIRHARPRASLFGPFATTTVAPGGTGAGPSADYTPDCCPKGAFVSRRCPERCSGLFMLGLFLECQRLAAHSKPAMPCERSSGDRTKRGTTWLKS
jgi:hypothetical protein